MKTGTLLGLMGLWVLSGMGCQEGNSSDDDSATEAVPTAVVSQDPWGYVGEEIVLDASGSSGAMNYLWDFGDGETSDSSSSPSVSHVFTSPGHYTAVLTVTGANGAPDSDSAVVTVVHPPLAVRPPQAGVIDSDGTGARMFIALPDFDAVAVVDREIRGVEAVLSTCDTPRTLSHGRGKSPVLVVACEGSGEVDVFNTETLLRVATVAAGRGSRPHGVVVTEDGNGAWVGLRGRHVVARLDLSAAPAWTGEEVGFPDPRGLSLTPQGLVITRFRSPDEEGQWGIWDGQTLSMGSLPFDPGPDSDTTARGVPTYLQQAAISPDGRRVFFPSLQANIARGEYRDGQALTFETTVRGVVSQAWLDPTAGETGEESGPRKVLDNRDLCTAAAFSPRGDYLFVASSGSEVVDVLDAFSTELVRGLGPVGGALTGTWVSPDGQELWVVAETTRELVGFDISDLVHSPPEIARMDLRPGGVEVLAADVLLGKQVFHRARDPRMSKDGYISCASCHLEGEEDGRVWDFTDRGEGLRNTISLLGREGAGQGPIHWSANFNEIHDFENDIRNAFQGVGFLTEEDWQSGTLSDPLGEDKAGLSEELDALAAYVTSFNDFGVSPYRQEDGQLTEGGERGQELFLSEEVGCAACHIPGEYTDSQWLDVVTPLLHDVGTLTEASGQRRGEPLTGLDTPTLRGLWATAPYLHDGSAATLMEVLTTRNPLDLHGMTGILSEKDREDLVEFLLQVE